MNYRSVVFDMDGVILNFEGDNFNWKYEAVSEVLKHHGVNPEEMPRERLGKFLGDGGVKKCVKVCNEHGVDAKTIWTEIAEETSKRRAEKIRAGDFGLFPDVKEVLEKLRSEDVQMGVISNAPEMAILETVEYFDLKQYFDFYRGIEDFEDLSDRKPHPDHLNFARAELKREPFIYAGDHSSDVEAAIAAGMDSYWVNRNGRKIDVSPTYERSDLKDLPSIVIER